LAQAIGLDLTHSQTRYWNLLAAAVGPGEKWLDIGCGRQIVPDWAACEAEQRKVAERARLLAGIDADRALEEHPLLTYRVWGWGGKLPFRDGSFSLLSANMVAEHVDKPENFLRDVQRVLAPGGRFVFHTPNRRYPLVRIAQWMPDWLIKRIVWHLEERKADDVFPTHYLLNSPEEIAALAGRAGLRVSEIAIVGSAGSFGATPVLGILECALLRFLQSPLGLRWNSNLLVVLERS
jgi:SAM-dependent methyltransferase